jgi:hypothetical protein
MTSLTPSNISTEVLMVDLASIIRDPSWPVDPTLVTSFRASIVRGEPPILDLSLNRMRLSDGSIGLEIIDGMHRLEALLQEGVTEHTAKVREYTTNDAFYARIATSIGKPNELLRQRAERALREGFIRDLAAHLEGAAFYQRGMTEDGNIIPLPRREPLPSDPLLALGTILWVHFAAKPEVTEDWERYIITWLDDIATRLGKTPEWLRDEILDITALLGEELPGKRSAERVKLLLAIPDDGILRLVLARLKSESHLSTTDLRFALDMLGCGPDVSRHTWLKSRGLQEMRGILGHATLSQLARDYGEALRKVERNKLLPRQVPLQTSPSVPSPQGDAPFDPLSQLPGRSIAPVDSRPVDQSQVFGIVSPTFGGTQPKQLVKSVAPSPAIKGLVPRDYYAQAHDATDLLLRAWEVFDHLGGDWSRPDVQQDLLLLRALVEEYIQRGQAPTTN